MNAEPVIIVNFKTYDEVLGPRGQELAKICETVAKETGKAILIAPPNSELALTCKAVGISVLAQHADNVGTGSYTGHVSPNAIKDAGAKGTLVNHAEHKISIENIKGVIERCKALNLTTVVCTADMNESRAVAAFAPDFIAVEPPELIGGNVSVTLANPDVVKRTVEEIRKINPNIRVLCGAGVKTGADVKRAIELGASGVLLASGVVKARSARLALEDLASGLLPV